MRVVLGPGCDRAWRESLTPWQERQLADLYRQGRHLRDRTNHGGDYRWRQAGVKYRTNGFWQRNRRSEGHERVIIDATPYGYRIVFIRRQTGWAIDPETGAVTVLPEVWVPINVWHVASDFSSSYDPTDHPRVRDRT